MSRIDKIRQTQLAAKGLFKSEKPEPASSGNSELLLSNHIEAVTKAILFEDCGNTQDWSDNTNLGAAAIRAYRPAVQAWRNDALESAAKIAERYEQFDAATDIRALIAQ